MQNFSECSYQILQFWLHGGQQSHVKIDRIQQEHAPEDYKLNEWRYI